MMGLVVSGTGKEEESMLPDPVARPARGCSKISWEPEIYFSPLQGLYYMYIHVYIYIETCMYIHMCMYIYIYAHVFCISESRSLNDP